MPPGGTPPEGADGGAEDGGPIEGFYFNLSSAKQTHTVVQNAKAKISVNVTRSPSVERSGLPITVRVIAPPKITAKPLVIGPSSPGGDIELEAAADADQGNRDVELEGQLGEGSKAKTTVKVFVRGSPGKLDTTFGTAGSVRISHPEFQTGKLLIDKDDKIVVVGQSGSDGGVALRLLADGILDQSFGGGRVTLAGKGNWSGAALQPDGKLVVAGYAGPAPSSSIVIVRLLPDGKLDETFGTLGVAVIPLPSGGLGNFGVMPVVLAPDNVIVVGFSWVRSDIYYWGVLRYAGGVPAFSSGLWPPSDSSHLDGIGVRANGAIVGSGAGGGRAGVFQLTVPSLNFDPAFGSASLGYYSLPLTANAPTISGSNMLVELPGGKLVTGHQGFSAGGGPDPTSYILRFLADGSALDPTFGDQGKLPVKGFLRGIAVAADGSLLASAYSRETKNLLIRFSSNGSPDLTFGDKGFTQITDTLFSIASQKNGQIVVLGYGSTFPNVDIVVQRFWN